MTAIVQYDNRTPAPHADMRDENRSYCQDLGYKHLMLIREKPTAPPYWDKLAAVLTVLDEEEHDVVLFLDTDAVVLDKDLDLRTFIPEGKSIAIGAISPGQFNAGVYAVRGDSTGKALLADWMSHYDKAQWATDGDSFWTPHEWGGMAHEQGVFNEIIAKNRENEIHAYGPDVILHCDHFRTQQGYCLADIQAFVDALATAKIAHFCGGYRTLSEIRQDARTKKVTLCRQ